MKGLTDVQLVVISKLPPEGIGCQTDPRTGPTWVPKEELTAAKSLVARGLATLGELCTCGARHLRRTSRGDITLICERAVRGIL